MAGECFQNLSSNVFVRLISSRRGRIFSLHCRKATNYTTPPFFTPDVVSSSSTPRPLVQHIVLLLHIVRPLRTPRLPHIVHYISPPSPRPLRLLDSSEKSKSSWHSFFGLQSFPPARPLPDPVSSHCCSMCCVFFTSLPPRRIFYECLHVPPNWNFLHVPPKPNWIFPCGQTKKSMRICRPPNRCIPLPAPRRGGNDEPTRRSCGK